MKSFWKLLLLPMAHLSIGVAQIDVFHPAAVPFASDADIAAYYFKGCVPGSNQVTLLKSGVTEYACEKDKGSEGPPSHLFGSNLFVATTNRGHESNIGFRLTVDGPDGFDGIAYGLCFGGQVDSATGTFKAVVYDLTESDDVNNLLRECSGDEVLCFKVKDGICHFEHANQGWERDCRDLKAVKFLADS